MEPQVISVPTAGEMLSLSRVTAYRAAVAVGYWPRNKSPPR